MKVWLVGSKYCEYTEVRHVCTTKSVATKRWEEIRKELIEDARKHLDQCKKEEGNSFASVGKELYERILTNLSEPNPELMNNYPQEEPFIRECETE